MDQSSLLEARARYLFTEIDKHNLGGPYLEAMISIILGPRGSEYYDTYGLDDVDLELIRTQTPSQRIQAAEHVLTHYGIAVTYGEVSLRLSPASE